MAYDPIIYGGSKSSVKGYSSARSKYFDDLEKERKKKESETIAFGGSEPNSKAAKVEQSKGFWGHIGDFGKGVFEAGGNIIAGGADSAQETSKGVKNLIETQAQLDKESNFQKGREEINDKYKKEADEKVWKGFENAAFDELP